MIMETRPANPGVFYFKLETIDLNRRNESGDLAWPKAIETLKCQIDKRERSYDEENETWEILDTPENREIISNIRDQYLIDKNQLSMF